MAWRGRELAPQSLEKVEGRGGGAFEGSGGFLEGSLEGVWRGSERPERWYGSTEAGG